MFDSILQSTRIPARTLFICLSAITYVLICLVFTAFAVRLLHSIFPGVTTASRLIGLLVIYVLILAVLDIFLAFVFTVVFHGHLFAVIRFIAAGFFFVLPITLLIFALTVSISNPLQVSSAVLFGVCLVLLIVAALLIGTYSYARFIEPYRLRTTFHQIRSPKLAALDRPLRIVLLADIQTDRITAYERSVFEQTLKLKPDLILLAGDYLQCPDRASYHRTAKLLQDLLKELNFTAPLGVFAIAGNAESYNGNDCFSGTAVRWLFDQSTTFGLGHLNICLTGLSLETGATYVGLPPHLLSNLNSANFNIVLSHQPDFVLDLPVGHAIDLCLAGHTHGGQICLPFVGALTTACRIPRSQAQGLHCINGTDIFISRGIGMERGWAPRLRFLCPPEIVVLDLVP